MSRAQRMSCYVSSFFSWVYFSVSEFREVWAYAPKRRKNKYPDISAKQKSKKSKQASSLLINENRLIPTRSGWWGGGVGGALGSDFIPWASQLMSAAQRRFGWDAVWGSLRRLDCQFVNLWPSQPGLQPALWSQLKEGTNLSLKTPLTVTSC